MLKKLQVLVSYTRNHFHEVTGKPAFSLNHGGERGNIRHSRKIGLCEGEKIQKVGEIVDGSGDGGSREQHVLKRFKLNVTTRVKFPIFVPMYPKVGPTLINQHLPSLHVPNITEKLEKLGGMGTITTLNVEITHIHDVTNTKAETSVVRKTNKVPTLRWVHEFLENSFQRSAVWRRQELVSDTVVDIVQF
jgi:hypothetical protein